MRPIHEALNVSFAKLAARRLQPVAVAVVDSGVDATHPDLRKRVVAAWKIDSGNGLNRVVRCRNGRNHDEYGHGSGVAGIITQIAPNARIIDVRVLDETNSATGEELLAGFEAAIETGARLINLSLACRAAFADRLHWLCEKAYHGNQIVVASKRNMPLQDNGFPAELSSCIGVDRARFASPYTLQFLSKPPIEFAARGENVMTTAAGGGYRPVTGTSFATPTVTGLCALLIGAFPDLRLFEIKTILRNFAKRES